MKVTNVRIQMAPQTEASLLAFAKVTFDDQFVISDIRVIQGPDRCFIAMPARKLSRQCPNCMSKSPFLSRYCCQCGKALPPKRPPLDDRGRPRIYEDIVHPVTQDFRALVQDAVLTAYRNEVALTQSRPPVPVAATVEDPDAQPPYLNNEG